MTHCPGQSRSPHAPLRPAQSTVNGSLTAKRRRPVTENSEYAAFARRVLRAYGRRIAAGDVESLAHMISLADDINDAIAQAVTGLRDTGYSWAEIGSRLGVTRQAAQQRWGRQAIKAHTSASHHDDRAHPWHSHTRAARQGDQPSSTPRPASQSGNDTARDRGTVARRAGGQWADDASSFTVV